MKIEELPKAQDDLAPRQKGSMMVLFLDFDGVLHPSEVYLEKGKPALREEGHALFEHAALLADLLEPHPQVKIVLSTSWVSVFRDFDRVKGFLPELLQARVIGATWHSKGDLCGRYQWRALTRYEQVAGYVLRNRLADWIALDDDDDGWPIEKRHHLVHTDVLDGLSDVTAQAELIDKLSGRT